MSYYSLVTGASKGIGLELSKLLAKDGHNLILVARSIDLLNQIKEDLTTKYNIDIVVIAKDLTDPLSAKELYNEVKTLNLDVDILINNAGYGDYGLFTDCNIEYHNKMIQLNITTLIDLCYYFANDMKTRKSGKIMNVGSIASFFCGPLMSTYYATKAFVLSFSEALSKELKNDGITVTALCPGTTDTNFFVAANASNDKTNLLKKMRPASKEAVAKYGYKKMMKNKVVAVHGFKNRAAIFFGRFVSRKAKRNIVYNIQKQRKQ